MVRKRSESSGKGIVPERESGAGGNNREIYGRPGVHAADEGNHRNAECGKSAKERGKREHIHGVNKASYANNRCYADCIQKGI